MRNVNSKDAAEPPNGLLEEVNEPEVDRHLFHHAADPHFMLDLSSGAFVDVNEAFLSLIGYTREQMLEGRVTVDDLIVPQHEDLFELGQRAPERIPRDTFEVKMLDRDGNPHFLEVAVNPIELRDNHYVIASARDLTGEKQELEELRDQLNEAMKSNNRILALNEKIKKIPILTSSLLDLNEEPQIFERARTRLRKRTGLNYSEVKFFLYGDQKQELHPFSEDDANSSSIPVHADHPVSRAVKTNRDFLRPDDDTFFLPIQGSEQGYGVMKVSLNTRERELMEGNQSSWNGYKETLVTLSNLLGLILQNHRLTRKIHEKSIHDELTQIYNRRYFNRKLKEEVERAVRYQHPLSLLIIDADDFKNINDTYGHQQGDHVLSQIASTFEENCRKTDVVCRYGGDEFGLILPETNRDSAERKARMIISTFENRPFALRADTGSDHYLHISVSIGVSFLPGDKTFDVPDEDIGDVGGDKLLRAADQCMYRAKASSDSNMVVDDGLKFSTS